jgi:hypothetical protein
MKRHGFSFLLNKKETRYRQERNRMFQPAVENMVDVYGYKELH